MAGSVPHTVVHYDGTNYGRIYLGDVGKRRGLGGAVEGVTTLGQDRYIEYGMDATFVQTGQVLMSASDWTSSDGTAFAGKAGTIRNWVNKGAFTVDFGV